MDGEYDLQKLAERSLFSVQTEKKSNATKNCYWNRRARITKIPTRFMSRELQDYGIIFIIYERASNVVTSPVV